MTGLKRCHLWDRTVTSITVLMVKRWNKTKAWKKKGRGRRAKTWKKWCPIEFQWAFQLLWEFCSLGSLMMLSALNNVRRQDDKSIMKWKGFGRKWLWHNWGTILTFAWRRSDKTMKSLSKDSQCPCWDSNSAPPEYKSRPQSNLSGGTGMIRNKYEVHDTKQNMSRNSRSHLPSRMLRYQLIKGSKQLLNWSINSHNSMEPIGSLLCSQERTTGTYKDSNESSQHPPASCL